MYVDVGNGKHLPYMDNKDSMFPLFFLKHFGEAHIDGRVVGDDIWEQP